MICCCVQEFSEDKRWCFLFFSVISVEIVLWLFFVELIKYCYYFVYKFSIFFVTVNLLEVVKVNGHKYWKGKRFTFVRIAVLNLNLLKYMRIFTILIENGYYLKKCCLLKKNLSNFLKIFYIFNIGMRFVLNVNWMCLFNFFIELKIKKKQRYVMRKHTNNERNSWHCLFKWTITNTNNKNIIYREKSWNVKEELFCFNKLITSFFYFLKTYYRI